MAFLTFVFSADIANFIENYLPFKGTITSGLCFLALTRIDAKHLGAYQWLVDSAILFYAVFEMTQVCHVCFKLSRFLRERIDFAQGMLSQWPTFTILTLSALACSGTIYTVWIP